MRDCASSRGGTGNGTPRAEATAAGAAGLRATRLRRAAEDGMARNRSTDVGFDVEVGTP
jgi:hypothetical protein